MNQHDKLRAQNLCAACGKTDKPVGLLLHWECHRKAKARHDGGYGVELELRPDKLEELL